MTTYNRIDKFNNKIMEAIETVKNAYWMCDENDGSQEARDLSRAKFFLRNHGFTTEQIRELEEGY